MINLTTVFLLITTLPNDIIEPVGEMCLDNKHLDIMCNKLYFSQIFARKPLTQWKTLSIVDRIPLNVGPSDVPLLLICFIIYTYIYHWSYFIGPDAIDPITCRSVFVFFLCVNWVRLLDIVDISILGFRRTALVIVNWTHVLV